MAVACGCSYTGNSYFLLVSTGGASDSVTQWLSDSVTQWLSDSVTGRRATIHTETTEQINIPEDLLKMLLTPKRSE